MLSSQVFAYEITIGALDADACAAPNATTPATAATTATSNPKGVLMLAMASSAPFLSLLRSSDSLEQCRCVRELPVRLRQVPVDPAPRACRAAGNALS